MNGHWLFLHLINFPYVGQVTKEVDLINKFSILKHSFYMRGILLLVQGGSYLLKTCLFLYIPMKYYIYSYCVLKKIMHAVVYCMPKTTISYDNEINLEQKQIISPHSHSSKPRVDILYYQAIP